MSKKPAVLGNSIIATKGTAVPTTATPEKPAADKGKVVKKTAITVKLSNNLYVRMKTYGALNRETNQTILEEALIGHLDKLGA